jgi:hypothetical protein
VPSSEATVEIETASGKVVRLQPELPVPFFYAWAYRLARRFGAPVVSSVDPQDLSVEVPLPAWICRH